MPCKQPAPQGNSSDTSHSFHLHWDIFCRVIDNLGDIGVCWRLSVQLARRGHQVRLWMDHRSGLDALAPDGCCGVTVLPWTDPLDTAAWGHLMPCDVLVEAFGCTIDEGFLAAYARHLSATGRSACWINLEYLSAEKEVERCHKLPSWVQTGPGAKLSKHFFYPGWTDATGGLLREDDLLYRQSQFDRAKWLSQWGVNWQGKRLISLFCYEPAALGPWLDALVTAKTATCILVTNGRATEAMHTELTQKNRLNPLWNEGGLLSFCFLPMLSQLEFDHLLWASDVNFVRGEDSLVRAIWAGRPLVWQIYPQHDGVHHVKLDAWLNWLGAPATLRNFHHAWNGLYTGRQRSDSSDTPRSQDLPPFVPELWQTTLTRARYRLLQQPDLVSSLIDFIANTL